MAMFGICFNVNKDKSGMHDDTGLALPYSFF